MAISPDHHISHLQVAHANMEARIEQSMACFELQEQLKQAGQDSTAQQALTEEIRSLTSQIMSRLAHLSLQYKTHLCHLLLTLAVYILCTWVESLASSSLDHMLDNVQLHKANRVQSIISNWHFGFRTKTITQGLSVRG